MWISRGDVTYVACLHGYSAWINCIVRSMSMALPRENVGLVYAGFSSEYSLAYTCDQITTEYCKKKKYIETLQ